MPFQARSEDGDELQSPSKEEAEVAAWSASPDPPAMDGDEPLSLASWRRATARTDRSSRRATVVVVVTPVVVFLGVALILFRRLMDDGVPAIHSALSAELGRAATGLVRVEATWAAAEALARANWWTLALTSTLLLALAGGLAGLLGGLLRLLSGLVPRSRADLRVYQGIAHRARRSLMPALWTAAAVYFVWLVVTALRTLSAEAADPFSTILPSAGLLVAGLLLLIVAHLGAHLCGLLRRWEVPKEHLLRYLARSTAGLVVLALLPPLAGTVLLRSLPALVEAVVDRPVLRRLEAEVRAISQEHELPPRALLQAVEDIPHGLQPQRAPLAREVATLPPLWRGLEALGWLTVGLLVGYQLLLGYLAPGRSRWVWPACAAAGTALARAALGGRSLAGELERLWLLGSWTALFTVLMIVYILGITPSPGGGRFQGGDLAHARRRFQGIPSRPPSRDSTCADPVAAVYRRVGCSLEER